ncbi:recombinase family protein [Kibdelosporangium aridum]|uniref:Site-specific DNA recombinase n=1 Tax=Kibdelosporangium aridum TaxID=2030 RepID=A0A1W2EXP9_KIBAR|nr:recombinase family protein [Kibdelosporangium aridum]SMD14454.1 Site-specific DNA recombinase [Kibdelosporangium aridum]
MTRTEENETKTAIIYLRVSTKEQAAKGGQSEGFSIPAQREALHRKAQSLGAAIIEEFRDAGESAKSADRPDLQRMLRYLLEHHVDYVLVHKIDRLARNRVDDIEITMAIKESGATLVSATENIDETPSGMLVHGIMSSIAEFYSRNLATEVHKGMSQKARTGGTPGKAPLGYRNVGRFSPEGREERTVEVDPERAELITWAFKAFATGDWTLRSLADELELRGLTTRHTPKQPSRPLRPNVLHSLLTNPYYKGEVVYRGIMHRGNHQRLTDPATWQRVQDVLSAHAAGEKRRDHPHYLKSSVFCGDCESRLIITNARNRHGVIYPYFVCLGRQQKRTSCTRKAMLIATVEHLVKDHWATVTLDALSHQVLEAGVRAGLSAQHQEAATKRKQLLAARAALNTRRQKLVEAIYTGVVPMDLVASEQKQLTSQLTKLEEQLSAANERFDQVEATLTRALDLVREGCDYYMAADPLLRRLLNQAVFTRLYIDDRGVRAVYAEPFDLLLDPQTMAAVQATANKPTTDTVTPTAVLGRLTPTTNQKARRARRATAGFFNNVRVSAFGYEGLKADTLAGLRDSLSNLKTPLLRALELCDQQRLSNPKRQKYNTSKAVIAQSGAADPSAVRLKVKENHKLKPVEVTRLVQANQAGMTQRELATKFDISLETVNRHLRRHRQAMKLGCAVLSRRTDTPDDRSVPDETTGKKGGLAA